MTEPRTYFYHNFPRPRHGESRRDILDRGWAVLKSIRTTGLILAPEIVEWRTPVSIGSPLPIRIFQRRICFTELSRRELSAHAERFGPFALEFCIGTLRRAGALPVIYMPQSMSKKDLLTLLGPFLVSHIGHIKRTLEQLQRLNRWNDPTCIAADFPGATEMAADCVLTLRNGDESRGTVQEFRVPWGAISDFLRFLSFENAPFDAMNGAMSIAQSLFYPSDDDHTGEALGYYRQREWRITADYRINDRERVRPLDAGERASLARIDGSFWTRELRHGDQTFTRVDRAAALLDPNPDELLAMVTGVVVPKELVPDAHALFGDLVREAE